jgi:hypothetical protein
MRVGFGCDLILSKIRRWERIDVGILRTRLEQGPINGPLGIVGSSEHRHAILALRHVVAGELRVDVGSHGSLNVVAIDGPVVGHAASVAVLLVIHTADAARSGELVLVIGHVGHIVGHLDHSERVDDIVSLHAVKSVHLVHFTFLGFLLSSSMLLNVGLGVRQVTRPSRISSSDRALLEMSLEDIASGKRIAAQHAHVRAVAGVTEEMTLEVLGV